MGKNAEIPQFISRLDNAVRETNFKPLEFIIYGATGGLAGLFLTGDLEVSIYTGVATLTTYIATNISDTWKSQKLKEPAKY